MKGELGELTRKQSMKATRIPEFTLLSIRIKSSGVYIDQMIKRLIN